MFIQYSNGDFCQYVKKNIPITHNVPKEVLVLPYQVRVYSTFFVCFFCYMYQYFHFHILLREKEKYFFILFSFFFSSCGGRLM